MLAMPLTAEYGVFEMGMSEPGEINDLTKLLQPKIGILADICNAHRENFESEEEIAREKMKLVEHIPDNGLVILDRDSEWYAMMREHTCANVTTISMEGIADYVGRKTGDVMLNVNGMDYTMPHRGDHIMRNALRAIALGLELNMAPAEIEEGLRKFTTLPMRWQALELDGVHFINDAYNANPLSMRASLSTFIKLPGSGKRWAVLGGMFELGMSAEREHRELGGFIDELGFDELGFDGVVLVGVLASRIACKNVPTVIHCEEADEAGAALRENVSAGDRVLLKASRGEHLEKVLEQFKRS